MKKIPTYVSINEDENWGNLESSREHVAAAGARLVDNRQRNLTAFGDRITLVGREDVARKLNKWLVSRKTLKNIAKISRYVWNGDAFETEVDDIPMGKYKIKLHVRCAGEYCNVAAYADKRDIAW